MVSCVPRGVASSRHTWTACTPIVEPVQPSSLSGSTDRSTDVMVPGPARHVNREPGARSPRSCASRTSAFHDGQPAMSLRIVHTSAGVAETSTVPLAVICAVLSMSIPVLPLRPIARRDIGRFLPDS